jgi:hypothetical protein
VIHSVADNQQTRNNEIIGSQHLKISAIAISKTFSDKGQEPPGLSSQG